MAAENKDLTFITNDFSYDYPPAGEDEYNHLPSQEMKVTENHTPRKDIDDTEVVITDPGVKGNGNKQHLLFKSIETPDISANPTPQPQ